MNTRRLFLNEKRNEWQMTLLISNEERSSPIPVSHSENGRIIPREERQERKVSLLVGDVDCVDTGVAHDLHTREP